jgi:uncharacterized protein
MRSEDGRLLHRFREGEASITGNLDDYAFLVWGLIELYQATFEVIHLKTAIELNEDMLRHFWDEKGGGLYFTPDDGEALLVRKKEVYDGATASGNAVAMGNLLHLVRLTGRVDLEEKAAAIARAFSGQISQLPSGYTQFLTAIDFSSSLSREVVIVGPWKSRQTREMVEALGRGNFLPNHVTLFRPTDGQTLDIDALAPFVKTQTQVDGKPTAYVCTGHSCKAHTTDIKEMLEILRSRT